MHSWSLLNCSTMPCVDAHGSISPALLGPRLTKVVCDKEWREHKPFNVTLKTKIMPNGSRNHLDSSYKNRNHVNGIEMSNDSQEIELSEGEEFELQVVSSLSNLNDLLLLARLRLYFSAQKTPKHEETKLNGLVYLTSRRVELTLSLTCA